MSTITAGNVTVSCSLSADTTGNLVFQSGGNVTAMTIDTSQNVGIGTSSPTYQTQIYGTGQTTAALTDAGNKGGSLLLNTPTVSAGDGGALLIGAGGSGAKPFAAVKGLLSDGGGNTTGALAFSTRNATGDTALTERARIDSSGNFGVGTTSPASRLHLSGNDSTGPAQIKITNTTASATRNIGVSNSNQLVFERAGVATDALIDSSGNFAIPTSYSHTTASAANTFMRSDGYLQRSTSALKYKQDVRDYSGTDINALRPVLYKSKCDGDDQTKDHLGIVADEAHEAGITELVTYGAEGEVEGFQYERLTVVLLKAMQEQQQMIETLQAKVAALEGASA